MRGYIASGSCELCGASYSGGCAQRHCSVQCYLLSKIKIDADCWMWTGAKLYNGYGTMSFAKKAERAHRASYRAFRGPIGDGLWVLHTCDKPDCINPSHLFLGTPADNAIDRDTKGRGARGAASKRSQLNDEIVRGILKDNRPNSEIAKEFGLTTAAIWAIKHRKTWKHVA